jgi:VWFA-related protein
MTKNAFPLLLLLLLVPAPALLAQGIVARGEITVSRLLVDAHVVDSHGRPIEGLGPEDFRVTVNGRPAEVEAADWISYVQAAAYEEELAGEERREAAAGQVPGRLIVMFFQTDFQRQRVRGHQRMVIHSAELLERLGPNDRVAVVSFDSHLKLRLDFTTDREKIRRAVADTLKIDFPPTPSIEVEPSLIAAIDLYQAKKAATPERGLWVVAKALEKIEGPKSLLLFGWGLGHYTSFGVIMDRHYATARQALGRARTSVFTLDISDADYHSLEIGLQNVSRETGGWYERTHIFPRAALERVERMISGRYELSVKVEDLHTGMHTVDVRLAGRRGDVLARQLFETE